MQERAGKSAQINGKKSLFVGCGKRRHLLRKLFGVKPVMLLIGLRAESLTSDGLISTDCDRRELPKRSATDGGTEMNRAESRYVIVCAIMNSDEVEDRNR